MQERGQIDIGYPLYEGGGSTHIQVLDYGETLNCNAFRQIYLIDQNTTKKYSLNIKIDLFRQ